MWWLKIHSQHNSYSVCYSHTLSFTYMLQWYAKENIHRITELGYIIPTILFSSVNIINIINSPKTRHRVFYVTLSRDITWSCSMNIWLEIELIDYLSEIFTPKLYLSHWITDSSEPENLTISSYNHPTTMSTKLVAHSLPLEQLQAWPLDDITD